MPEYYPSIGDAIGSAMAHNARMAARHHADRATEDEHLPPVDVCPIHIPRPSILPDTCTCSHPNNADCHHGGAGFHR